MVSRAAISDIQPPEDWRWDQGRLAVLAFGLSLFEATKALPEFPVPVALPLALHGEEGSVPSDCREKLRRRFREEFTFSAVSMS